MDTVSLRSGNMEMWCPHHEPVLSLPLSSSKSATSQSLDCLRHCLLLVGVQNKAIPP